MAAALEAILLDAIGQADQVGVGLARAYEAARADLGEADLTRLLRRLFSDVEPLPWHALVPSVPWETIWTFNIDDVIENAFVINTARKQTATVRLWQDHFCHTVELRTKSLWFIYTAMWVR